MLPEFSDYREEAPSEFYLASDAELLARADGVFLVEGVALPVHTVLLRERCGLMKRLLNGGGAAHNGGIPLVHHLAAGRAVEVIMSDALPRDSSPRSLEGFTLKRVAHFLRFLYHPAEVAAIDFQLPGAAKTLSACVRLACALEVPALLDALGTRMEDTVDAHKPTLQRLIDWSGTAEECGLTRLWTKCVRELAVTLARGRKGVDRRTTSQADLLGGGPLGMGGSMAVCVDEKGAKTAVHDVALLRDLTPRTHLAVMATLLTSLRKVPGDPSTLVPSEDALAATLPALQPSDSPAAELAN